MAHRCGEWDGWEEGLVESILGPEEYEEEWNTEIEEDVTRTEDTEMQSCVADSSASIAEPSAKSKQIPLAARNPKVPVLMKETEMVKEKTLDMTGDICGGRGGELGRRLEAWLTVSGGAR